MRAFIGLTGAAIGGSTGWWLGSQAGLMAAVLLSGIGSGAGLYYFKKFARERLGG